MVVGVVARGSDCNWRLGFRHGCERAGRSWRLGFRQLVILDVFHDVKASLSLARRRLFLSSEPCCGSLPCVPWYPASFCPRIRAILGDAFFFRALVWFSLPCVVLLSRAFLSVNPAPFCPRIRAIAGWGRRGAARRPISSTNPVGCVAAADTCRTACDRFCECRGCAF